MKKSYYLIIIPVFYFLLSGYFHQAIGTYSVRTADPEYIYYICAVSIANGRMEVGNIDHPGTTLQYFMAATFRITHFFRANNAPFTEDILSHPDLYLKVVNLAINFLIAMLLIWAGFVVLSISNNIWYALIIQFTPFATEIIYGNLGRITPETTMPVFLVLLTLLVISLLFQKNEPASWKTILLFAGIFAITLALKLTMAFLLIIPLILIEKWKNKIYFSLATLLFFLLFAIPVSLQLDYFWNWIKGLFLYSGQYGQGEKNVVKINEFLPNILSLYKVNRVYFNFLLLYIIAFATAFLLKRKETKKIQNKTTIAILLVVVLQTLALGKHFKTTYFIPALMLLPIMVILTTEYLKIWFPKNLKVYVSPIIITLMIFFVLKSQHISMLNLSQHFEKQNELKMKAHHFFETVETESVKIIVPGFYGGPIREYALMTSYQWSGKNKSFYKPVLAKLYPDSYMFYPWDNTLNYWAGELKITKEKPAYLYFENKNTEESVLNELGKYFPENYVLNEVFFNAETNEIVYQILLKENTSELENS